MARLTEFTRYADAQAHASSQALWELFDGDREHLNIAHECIGRHADGSGRAAVRIAHADGADEFLSFDDIAAGSARFAHWLDANGIQPGDRIAFMLEPSLPFYVCLFGAMQTGAISVPLFTLFGLDGLRLRVDDCKPKLLITNAEKAEVAGKIAGVRVIVADAGLLEEIARITPKPVSHVVVTHYHADHVYGLQVFKDAGATILAHRDGKLYLNSDTAELRMKASREDLAPWVDENTRLVPADRWIDAPLRLTVGGLEMELRPAGPAHTAEDLVVWFPSLKVLMAGDVVFRNRVPFVGQADSGHWIEALDTLLSYDAAVIVPGHGPVSRSARAELQMTRDYLAFLRKAMGEAARNMDPFEEAYARTDWSRFAKMPLFDAANRINAYNTYLLMERSPP